MSINIGSLVGTLKVIDEASGVIGKVQAGIGGLTNVMSKMGGVAGDAGVVISTAFSGFATGGPAGAALGAGVAVMGQVINGIQSCVKEATASEAVWASLGAAVGRTGESWQALKAGTEDALLAMSKVTTYSDEQLAAALEKLMTFGLSYDDAMKALGQTLDFAAAKHMDLESAATLVGKAMDGNTAILKRYGVDVTTTKDATAALKDAHDAAKIAIEGMGKGVDAWVVSVSAAIAATPEFEAGLAGAKDKAGYLIDQFQQGNIDLPQFTQAMTSLGVPLDETKMKAGGAEEVLKALNTQFGGAAGEAAKTYAGTQERLKNATGEVSEKIGMMFLPALASMTEAMIPVVDWLGQGVDAVQGWLTEVGKMPEVQAVMTVVNEAFAGFWKYLEDIWKFIQDMFGPALQELWEAFKELWDALSPIGEALQELLSIFGDTSGIDLLKMVLGGIVLEIKAVAAIIKEVAPYIKAFAQGFKDAADFITPILKQIVEAVQWFCDMVKLGFQTLYTWLVGGSLWMDMWNTLLSIASQMAGALLGDLGTKLLKPIQDAFMGAMQGVQDLWDTSWKTIQTAGQTAWDFISGGAKVWEDLLKGDFQGALDQIKQNWDTSWQAVQTTFTTLSQQIGGTINTQLEAWKTRLSTSTSQYAPIATQALTAMQSSVNIGMQLIQGDWQGALTSIQDTLTQWGGVATGIMQSIMGQLKGAMDQGIGLMEGAWTGLTGGLQQITQAAAAPMQAAAQTVMDSVSGAVTGFWNWLTGGSYWPEHLDAMRGMTDTKLGEVVNSFTKFGQDVTQTLTSALQGAQQAAQQGMSAISQALGGIGQGITQALNFEAPDANAICQQIYDAVAAMGKAASDPEVFDDAALAVSNGLMTIDQAVSDWLTGGTLTQQVAEQMHQVWLQMNNLAQTAPDVQKILASIVPTFAGESALTFANAIKTLSLETGQTSIDIEDLRTRLLQLNDAGVISDGAMDALSDTIDGFRHAMTGIPEGVFEDFASPEIIAQINSMGESIQTVTQATVDMQAPTTTALDAVASTFSGAFDTISTAATGFWDWLVGGSVWPEGMTAVEDTTQGSMERVTAIISETLQVLHDKVLSWFEAVQAEHVGFWDNYFIPKLTEALATIDQLWQNAWMQIMNTVANICGQIMAGLTNWYGLIQAATMQNLTLLTGTFQTALSGIYGMFTNTFSSMASATQSYMSSIAASVANAFAQVQAAAAQMKAQMVTGSIWPEMLEEMQAQTLSALGNIVGDFQGAFGDVAFAVPTMPSQAGPSRGSEASAPLISRLPQSITIPVQVQVDGATVARTVTTRLVQQISARRGRA